MSEATCHGAILSVMDSNGGPSEKKEVSNLAWCVASLVLLLCVGGFVFSRLERQAELEHYKRNQFFHQQMRELYQFDQCKEEWFKSMEFCKRQKEFDRVLQTFFERNGNEMKDHGKWTFWGSVFFVITLVTTLGYGNFHPRTPEGQLFTVIFGIVGLPVMSYVLSHLGRFVVDVWMPMCPTIATRQRRIVVLCCLLVCFILLGGTLFKILEAWSFLEACYFSACTLMSIGFGDYLPDRITSRIAASVFILVGLGVAASFIALLQVHVEIRGEQFAKHVTTWYNTVTTECSGGTFDDESKALSARPASLA